MCSWAPVGGQSPILVTRGDGEYTWAFGGPHFLFAVSFVGCAAYEHYTLRIGSKDCGFEIGISLVDFGIFGVVTVEGETHRDNIYAGFCCGFYGLDGSACVGYITYKAHTSVTLSTLISCLSSPTFAIYN